jgi:hypothetical protein
LLAFSYPSDTNGKSSITAPSRNQVESMWKPHGGSMSWKPFGVNKLIRVGFLTEQWWSFCHFCHSG